MDCSSLEEATIGNSRLRRSSHGNVELAMKLAGIVKAEDMWVLDLVRHAKRERGEREVWCVEIKGPQ
ncbi:hypothetical protein Pyn_10861 [Prunus yedoensis var. nudiflora]|uniref:Uncharacterized protein n=1 Tax=Prunus yedoensis var. nudiflora TaxID=2094558 RepID=A0A314UUC2_PRUYE|nr:hypothetical protein Pyn_10861 [Prunus yedoensis var. nudiflora]